ncbi:biotin carboxylase [Litchfieldella anticariensis FP35 = DSM 16096]|uniref:Biotin carboxylase n=1 Tax=Litchfieldella anticariensis (strain DSM 16096 / CECT 5854 / CIP 108499 / LMG 22089 / FP35) TaxID=1121939 RepID=S2KL08_LITA3|nr:biotin carboxylase [Halomonas anticariensis]EPC01123.1 biotin carboxylase [Halomonas anticariensis FP35 = DSM 16096]
MAVNHFIARLRHFLSLWIAPRDNHRSSKDVKGRSTSTVEFEMESTTTGAMTMNKITSISDVRRYFHSNKEPIYFISATNFNLLGIGDWVGNFRHINYIDCFDGRQKNVFVPKEKFPRDFESIEDINNYLLEHKEVIDYLKSRGGNGTATFLMFDEHTEEICQQLGLKVAFPPAALRSRMDNKIETVRIGNKAGVPSVPNVLAKVGSYQELLDVSKELGNDLVVQTAFGDSGHTTFFIANEDDYYKHAEEIEAEPEVKIMKRINCRGSAIEACATRCGTVVGPLMTELVGFKSLTPYKGGWCGNEMFAGAFTQEVRDKAREYTFKFGEALREEGYRGYFELDFLIDMDTHEVYLGELNPRVTGASSLTNVAAFAHSDIPLFLFHLLEFSDQDFDIDIQEINDRWAHPDSIDSWSQLVIKHTEESVDLLTRAPQSGVWKIAEDDSIAYDHFNYHPHAAESEQEAFFLRISGVGDFRYEGADLGILITRGRLMDDDFQLTPRAKAWIEGIRGQFDGQVLQDPVVEEVAVNHAIGGGNFKIL